MARRVGDRGPCLVGSLESSGGCPGRLPDWVLLASSGPRVPARPGAEGEGAGAALPNPGGHQQEPQLHGQILRAAGDGRAEGRVTLPLARKAMRSAQHQPSNWDLTRQGGLLPSVLCLCHAWHRQPPAPRPSCRVALLAVTVKRRGDTQQWHCSQVRSTRRSPRELGTRHSASPVSRRPYRPIPSLNPQTRARQRHLLGCFCG